MFSKDEGQGRLVALPDFGRLGFPIAAIVIVQGERALDFLRQSPHANTILRTARVSEFIVEARFRDEAERRAFMSRLGSLGTVTMESRILEEAKRESSGERLHKEEPGAARDEQR